MGREIRRVPPDWEHPILTAEHVRNCEHHHESSAGHEAPLYDQSWREAADNWMEFARKWTNGERPSFVDEHPEYYPSPTYPWEYDEPPWRCYYREREWTPEEATAFQIYETVSEGTPVSPVFKSEDELVVWVVSEWGRSEEAARRFVQDGSVPSLMISGGRMASNVAMLEPDFDPRSGQSGS